MAIRVRFTRLHCNNANEDGILSDGDEPYAILATIAPGGPLNRRLLFAQTPTYSDVDRGNTRHPDIDLLDEDVQDSFAVVCQVMDSDDSEKELVYGLATVTAQVDFANALLNGETNLRALRTIVADALHRGVRAAALPLVDDDDPIGDPAEFSISRARMDSMAVDDVHLVRREVEGNSARYTLTFEVRKTA